jgi:cytochrome oxidase Cu insertion factor (SCO1/SenC/PrrC family)
MDYLIGSEAQLEPIWLAWHIDAFRDAQDPALINHSDVVYGIAPSGKLTTLYFGNFKTADIVHDVPLLASAS